MKYLITFTMILGVYLPSRGQTIKVDNLKLEEETISFSYSVSPKSTDRESYQLQVFSSTDNFTTALPINLPAVKAGEVRDASFNGAQIFGSYEGALQLKFRAMATTFPVQITTTAQKFKMGKDITISWEDFHESGFYDIELFLDGNLSQSLAKSHPSNSLTTTLSKEMEKGTYEVRVTPSNREELYSDDYSVEIKSGSKTIFYVAGGALAGAGLLVLTGGDGGETPGSALPNPPSPGDGN